jgi:hypothetical protein
MTHSILGSRAHKDEPPHGWGVLLALLEDWGTVLRLVLLICVPIAALVVIVALVAIYLGPIGVGALLTGGGSGYGVKRYLARCRRRQAKNSWSLTETSPDPPPQGDLGF